ncbi:uncharacterized protein G2W53_024106 [Senna tora]|uniref:Uncharacterized protein n=1 Tax=Senna tora TaxID=362788 RepID=A0A834TCA0_9FABA|nr:uncharacterized protein G2W53_024106 [Senna tora]
MARDKSGEALFYSCTSRLVLKP